MKTAMILAAGRGERLRPLTDNIPKALCLVHHIPLIEHHIGKLAQAGFQRIVINHAHLGGKIRQQLGGGKTWGVSIHYSPEPPGGLETGGGIVHALPLLGREPFLAVNADIYTDYSFCHHLPPPSLAQLILVRKTASHPNGDFGLTANGYVENINREYVFSGIAWYHPEFFSACKPGRFSLTPLLRQAVEKKQIRGLIYDGFWLDIGTPDRLLFANESAQRIYHK